ncbi:MAG TPA: FG-GAP-like repeat-containing protein, partial [Rhizomicrobium sp.]|nr:FG-GAP-like repeat-containing protein [Rhizomicrobium sp.]
MRGAIEQALAAAYRLVLASVAIVAVVATAHANSAPQMTVPGQFGVSQTGAATYAIPISVPPGTAGLAPNLSLDYSSQAQDGIVGWQWSLDGLPSIGRCPRTLAQDSTHGSVNYDANDRFCLNGQRLILVGGTYGADGSEYRTEIETFTRVIAHGTTGTGPTYFDVYTKSGQTLELGNTTDSRLIAVGTTTARAWSVDKISDVSGNYLTVTYTNDTTNGQLYPARIDYTGNDGASVAPYNSVQFTYNTSRPDVTPFYQAGSRQEVTVLLTDIKAFNGTTAISDYKLAYRLGSTTTRSRLTSVTQCDGAGTTCLTPTTFGWQGGTGQLTMTATANTLFQGFNVTPIDYNGDGLTDAIMWGPSTCPNYDVYEGTTSGLTFASVITTAMLGTGTSCAPSGQQDIDIEPDGNGDLLMSYFYLSTGGIPIPTHKVFVLKSSGSAFSTAFSLSSSAAAIAGDFNGDGRADFFSNASGTSFIYFGDGTGAFTPDAGHSGLTASIAADFDGNGCTDLLGTSVNYFCNPAVTTAAPPTLPSGSTMVFGDFNGDGKTDILVTNTTTTGTLYLSTGTGFAATSFSVPAGWGKYTITTTDIDGDGRSDLILIASGASSMYGSGTPHQIWLSTGTGFVQAVDGTGTPISIANSDTSVSASVADWNNDGAGDFLLKKASGDTQYNFTYVPELMTSVSNGLGATTTVTYDRINKNGTFYTKGSPGAYPIVPIDAAVYVVSQVTSSNGIGGNFSWSYAYGGAYGNVNTYSSVSIAANARTQFAGRPAAIGSVNNGSPLVGFIQVTVTDAQTHIVTTTNYRPDFPYTGLVSSQTSVHGAATLSSITNTWSSTNLGGTHNFVFLHQSVVSGHDLDGTALPTRTTSYTYDTFGNTLTTTISLPDGSSSTTTDTYTNDTVNWLLGQINTRSVAQVVGTSNLTRTFSFAHDPATGRITSETAQPSTNWALTTAYTFDAFGNRLTAATSGAGGGAVAGITSRTVSATYDANGEFMLTTTDALSHVDHFTYDARFGTVTSHTDPNSAVTSTTYDAFGRTTLTIQPDGTKAVTAYTLCPGTGCITGTAYHVAVTPQSGAGVQNGPAVTQHYDMLDRLLDTESQSFGAAATIAVVAYDANGRISQTSRPYLEVGGTPANTAYIYDDLARATQATMPDGSTNTYAYHGLSTSVTDGLSHTTTTAKNDQGLVASVTDPASHATNYVYDAFGDLATLTDPAGNVLTGTYDIRGNRTATADPDAGSWTYAYDVLGEMVSQTDAKSQTASLTYDLLGRPTQRVEVGVTSTWTWDSALHGVRALASATTGTSYSRTMTYDTLGRPSTTTLTIGGTNYVYANAYNATNGKIDTVTYPSGLQAKNVYTSLGYLSQIQNVATSATLFTVNARDAEQHLTQSTFGNGVATTQTFDAH